MSASGWIISVSNHNDADPCRLQEVEIQERTGMMPFCSWTSDYLNKIVADPKPIIYLNNAVTSWPKPPEVLAAVLQSLAMPVFGSGRTTGSQGVDYIKQAREEF